MKFIKITGLTVFLLLAGMTSWAQKERADKYYERFDYTHAIPHYNRYLESSPTDWKAMEKLADCYRNNGDFRSAEYWYGRAVKSPDANPDNYLRYGEMLMANEKWKQAVPWLEKYVDTHAWDNYALQRLISSKNYQNFFADSARYQVNTTNINTPGSEFSPIFYRNTLIFASTRGTTKEIFNWTGDNFLDLYSSQYFGKAELGEPHSLPGFANTKYHEGGTTFNPDGNVMYFTRNNFSKGIIRRSEEKVVGLKTYRAELIRNKWTNVEELPFNNDQYSVGHPCMGTEGKALYFISDKPGGYGGTDIYVSYQSGGGWTEPKNVGAEINSSGNEMFPWMSSTGVLYFASNGHQGLGGLDIYRVTSLGNQMQKIQNMGYPINSGSDDFGLIMDENTGTGFFSSNRRGGQGLDDIYHFRQKQMVITTVLDSKTKLPLRDAKVEVFGVSGLVSTHLTDDNGVMKFGLGRNEQFMFVTSNANYDESRKRVSSVTFEPETPIEVQFELDPNLVCEEVMMAGVVRNQDFQPIPNATVRVIPHEFTVEADATGNYSTELAANMEYDVRFERDGYMDRTAEVSTKGAAAEAIPLNAVLGKLLPDTAIYTVFYDYDDANLRSNGYQELDKVAHFMKRNPTAKLTLVSHSDVRGTKAYNNQLSKDRAIMAYEYLLREGIPAERLNRVWKGESRPAVDCEGPDCPEETHSRNRRTEIQFDGFTDAPLEMKDTEGEMPEPVEMEPATKTGKEAIKDMSETSSGKDKIKDNITKPSGKDDIKEGGSSEKRSNVTKEESEEAIPEVPKTVEMPAEEPAEEATPAEKISKEATPAEEPVEEPTPAEKVSKEATPAEEPAEEPTPAEKVSKEATPAEEPAEEPTPAEKVSKEATPAEEPAEEATPAEKVSKEATPAEVPESVEMPAEEPVKEATPTPVVEPSEEEAPRKDHKVEPVKKSKRKKGLSENSDSASDVVANGTANEPESAGVKYYSKPMSEKNRKSQQESGKSE